MSMLILSQKKKNICSYRCCIRSNNIDFPKMNVSSDGSSDEDFSVRSTGESSDTGDEELSDVGSSEAVDLMEENSENVDEEDDDSSYDDEHDDQLDVGTERFDEAVPLNAQSTIYWERDLEDFYDDMDQASSGLIVRLDPDSGKTSVSVRLSRDDPTPPCDDDLVGIFGDPSRFIDDIILDGTSLNRQREGKGGWVVSRRVGDSLALLLSQSMHLVSIELRFIDFESLRPVTRSLRENRSIRNICISCMDCGALWRGLEQMELLESLDVSGFPLHGQALQNLLTNTKSLDRLSIFGNPDGQRAMIPFLCDGLRRNNTLTRLSLQRGALDEEVTASLAKALTVNNTLSHLTLVLNRSGLARKNVLRAIGQQLPNIKGLTSLSIMNDNFDLHNLIVFMMGLEVNKSLTSCTMATLSFLSKQSPMLALIKFYMDLNHSHRGDVIGQPNIPLALWPRILARTALHGVSVLFHFLREEPTLLRGIEMLSP